MGRGAAAVAVAVAVLSEGRHASHATEAIVVVRGGVGGGFVC